MSNDFEQYKDRNAAREGRQKKKKDEEEQALREALPFWKQPDKIAKYT